MMKLQNLVRLSGGLVLAGFVSCTEEVYTGPQAEIREESADSPHQKVEAQADWEYVSKGPESAMSHVKMRMLNVPWKVKPGDVLSLQLEIEPDQDYMVVGPLETSGHFTPLEIQFFQRSGTDVKVGPWPEAASRTIYQREKGVSVYDKTTRIPVRVAIPSNPNFDQMRPMVRAVVQFQIVSETKAPASGAFSIHFAVEVEPDNAR